jgi:hypothetical protein
VADPTISIETSERATRATIREEKPGRSGLAFSLPLLAAVGVFYWRALDLASDGNFAPEALAKALPEVHPALHGVAGFATLAVLAGLILPARRLGSRASIIALTTGSPSMLRQKSMRGTAMQGEVGSPLDQVRRFDLRWETAWEGSWFALKLLPMPVRSARLVAMSREGVEGYLHPFPVVSDLAKLAKVVEALNIFLRDCHEMRHREGEAGFGEPFPLPPDPRLAARGPRQARQVINARRAFFGARWLVFVALCAALAAIGWLTEPLTKKANPAAELLEGARQAAKIAEDVWNGAPLPWEKSAEPERAVLLAGDQQFVSPPEGGAPSVAVPAPASSQESPASRLGSFFAAQVEPTPTPVMELSMGGDSFQEIRSEPYPYEEAFLAKEFPPVQGAEAASLLGAIIPLYQSYEERQSGSRPALHKLVGLLRHQDERVGVVAAACLGLIGDETLLRPLEDLRREILAERQGRKTGNPPPRQRLLGKVIEAQERIKERRLKPKKADAAAAGASVPSAPEASVSKKDKSGDGS